ncbi:hypothetical protein Micbo1qcDRAFT_51286 [Microdochium bolleyi]|uniref:Uncharacterized protein n=1 Tax=Microdochium bolleyi TaxID=196109 RepID=A0A136J6T1_9PEZI|nr:hypothetical protein Micbo1qcDRAFT_51286 [Microdochium bolleyi]
MIPLSHAPPRKITRRSQDRDSHSLKNMDGPSSQISQKASNATFAPACLNQRKRQCFGKKHGTWKPRPFHCGNPALHVVWSLVVVPLCVRARVCVMSF